MFIVNLMASVLALVVVGASTASVSKVENHAVCSAENTSFVASPKKTYYNSSENYGNTNGRFYNYTSYSVGCISPDAPQVFNVFANTATLYISDDDGYIMLSTDGDTGLSSNLVFGTDFKGADDALIWENTNLDVDWYIDGELVSSPLSDVDSNPSGEEYFDIRKFGQIGVSHYIWVFDHGTAPEPYTPVDILGDIAGGLTGGIVPVAEGIGNGLQSLVQDIFLNADHDGLSVFGIVTICFAGLALALGLSRWVLNFVDTLGARDR